MHNRIYPDTKLEDINNRIYPDTKLEDINKRVYPDSGYQVRGYKK